MLDRKILSGVVIDIDAPFQCEINGTKKICFYYSHDTSHGAIEDYLQTMGLDLGQMLPDLVSYSDIFILYKDAGQLEYSYDYDITNVKPNFVIDYNDEDILEELNIKIKDFESHLLSAKSRVAYLIYCKYGIWNIGSHWTNVDAEFSTDYEGRIKCTFDGNDYDIPSAWFMLPKKEFIKVAQRCFIDNNLSFSAHTVTTSVNGQKTIEIPF